MRLAELGYKVYDATPKSITFEKIVDKDYEHHYVELNFDSNTALFYTRYNNSNREELEVSPEVLEATLEMLKSKMVVIDYALQDNR